MSSRIEELRKKPYGELTAEERSLVNLNPIKPGEVRNPEGRKKGSVNWSTRIQNTLNDPTFLKTVIANPPREWAELLDGTPADLVTKCIVASLVKSVASTVTENKPIDKDTRALISLLNKMGYGDKVVHELNEGFFQRGELKFEVVPDRTDVKPENDNLE